MPGASGARAAVDPGALRDLLDRGIEAAGHHVGAGARDRLVRYLGLLARWNAAYNLTAVRDPRDMVSRHLLDCLALLPYLAGARLLDIGTGAGLPGLVLAMARPALRCDLVDSVGKKARFCRHAAAELGLANVSVLHARAETLADRACWDRVVSRATLDVAGLWSIAGPLLAPGGKVIAMKGRDPGAGLDALAGAGAVAEVVPLVVPGLDAARHLVVMRPEVAT